MKKLISTFLCLVICLFFVGCDNSQKQNVEAKEVLQKVLHKEHNFIFKSLVFDKVTEENLDKFNFPSEKNAINTFIPQGYTYVDLNFDDIDEMVIYSVKLDYFLVLRYYSEKVYGYIVPQRSLIDLKTDGSFMTSSGAGINSISNMSFKDSSLEIEDIACQDNLNNVYLLEGKASKKENVEKYFKDWNETTTKVSWEKLD